MARVFIVCRWCLWGVVIGLLWPAQSHATVVPYRSVDQMIQKASRVVRAKVVQKTYLWGPGRRHIYTDYQMQVLEPLKGDVGPKVTIRQVGGVMGGMVTRVPGSAQYKLEEEVVLFLEVQRPGGYYFVMDLAAGKYEVVRLQGQAYLQRDTHHIAFHRPLGTRSNQPSVYHLSMSETPLTLAGLRLSIARLQQAQSKVTPSTAKKNSQPALKTVGPKVLPGRSKRAKILLMMRRLQKLRAERRRDFIVKSPLGSVLRPKAKPAVPGSLLKVKKKPNVSVVTPKGGK
ncbi:MAG: hypothetical protein EP343_13145 [Deltaproteobacteria bacterium]|nr:MAG: hypothetical protein EP343_13145 [Deltaproteobacteria bacterium]